MTELLSNCCGAPAWGETDICSDCKEHCEFTYEEEELSEDGGFKLISKEERLANRCDKYEFLIKGSINDPKQQARELVDWFMYINQKKLGDHSFIYHPTAKACAIKVVDEKMETAREMSYNDLSTPVMIRLEKMKSEIEKL